MLAFLVRLQPAVRSNGQRILAGSHIAVFIVGMVGGKDTSRYHSLGDKEGVSVLEIAVCVVEKAHWFVFQIRYVQGFPAGQWMRLWKYNIVVLGFYPNVIHDDGKISFGVANRKVKG